MKLETAPNRASPATTKNRPVSSTMPTPSSMRCCGEVPAMDAVAASSTAAEEDVAETMAKRLVPSRP